MNIIEMTKKDMGKYKGVSFNNSLHIKPLDDCKMNIALLLNGSSRGIIERGTEIPLCIKDKILKFKDYGYVMRLDFFVNTLSFREIIFMVDMERCKSDTCLLNFNDVFSKLKKDESLNESDFILDRERIGAIVDFANAPNAQFWRMGNGGEIIGYSQDNKYFLTNENNNK